MSITSLNTYVIRRCVSRGALGVCTVGDFEADPLRHTTTALARQDDVRYWKAFKSRIKNAVHCCLQSSRKRFRLSVCELSLMARRSKQHGREV